MKELIVLLHLTEVCHLKQQNTLDLWESDGFDVVTLDCLWELYSVFLFLSISSCGIAVFHSSKLSSFSSASGISTILFSCSSCPSYHHLHI